MQQQPRRWPGFDKCVEMKLRWDVLGHRDGRFCDVYICPVAGLKPRRVFFVNEHKGPVWGLIVLLIVPGKFLPQIVDRSLRRFVVSVGAACGHFHLLEQLDIVVTRAQFNAID